MNEIILFDDEKDNRYDWHLLSGDLDHCANSYLCREHRTAGDNVVWDRDSFWYCSIECLENINGRAT